MCKLSRTHARLESIMYVMIKVPNVTWQKKLSHIASRSFLVGNFLKRGPGERKKKIIFFLLNWISNGPTQHEFRSRREQQASQLSITAANKDIKESYKPSNLITRTIISKQTTSTHTHHNDSFKELLTSLREMWAKDFSFGLKSWYWIL